MAVVLMSKKYYCPVCMNKYGKMKNLYSVVTEEGEKQLHCPDHGYQQKCNCSPDTMETKILLNGKYLDA